MDIFEKIDLNYKLSGEVINVLIHYLMTMVASGGDQRMNRNFVEAIASNMLVKQVNTYEKAVRYIRDQSKVKGKGAASGSISASGTRQRSYAKNGRSAKPEIPMVLDDGSAGTVSEEEFAAMMKKAAEIKASKKKGVSKTP